MTPNLKLFYLPEDGRIVDGNGNPVAYLADRTQNDDLHTVIGPMFAAAFMLRRALQNCRDAMYADDPSEGWGEIVAYADDALAASTGEDWLTTGRPADLRKDP